MIDIGRRKSRDPTIGDISPDSNWKPFLRIEANWIFIGLLARSTRGEFRFRNRILITVFELILLVRQMRLRYRLIYVHIRVCTIYGRSTTFLISYFNFILKSQIFLQICSKIVIIIFVDFKVFELRSFSFVKSKRANSSLFLNSFSYRLIYRI